MFKKISCFLLVILVILDFSSVNATGGSCLICTLISALLEEISIVQNLDGKQTLHLFCTSVFQNNPDYEPTCNLLSESYGANLTWIIKHNIPPELVCKGAKACPSDNHCKIFKDWPPKESITLLKAKGLYNPNHISARSLLEEDNIDMINLPNLASYFNEFNKLSDIDAVLESGMNVNKGNIWDLI